MYSPVCCVICYVFFFLLLLFTSHLYNDGEYQISHWLLCQTPQATHTALPSSYGVPAELLMRLPVSLLTISRAIPPDFASGACHQLRFWKSHSTTGLHAMPSVWEVLPSLSPCLVQAGTGNLLLEPTNQTPISK
jgi:hypothetical protein